jgi:hypothetical protein
MLFSVIYSVDVPEFESLDRFAPPDADELWSVTGEGSTEYSYLEGDWENGSHKKWCAILNREQFDEFVRKCHLSAESTETMGSIGAPGCGFWASAISFNSCDEDCIANAYVTPLPEVKRELNETKPTGTALNKRFSRFMADPVLLRRPLMISSKEPLFQLGQVVTTPAALQILSDANISPFQLLNRHVRGDFGECYKEDWEANEQAVKEGDRIFSVYKVGKETLWLITEADRSSTCVLTPDDY